MSIQRPTPSKEAIALLPEFPRLGLDRISLVDSASKAREALAQLRDHPDWGFDTESKPTFRKDELSDGPHTVQFSTLQHAWVFQLFDAACRDCVADLLVDSAHTKAGFGLGDDTQRIQSKLQVAPVGVVELNHLFRVRGYRKDMGVKGAVAVLFNQRFVKSKKAATSNWAQPQLSPHQIVYAANDAYAAAKVHQALRETS